jgi:hypothetical protein
VKWFLDLSTKAKLSISFGILILILAAVIGAAYSNLKDLQKQQTLVFGNAFVKMSLLQEFRGDLENARSQMLELIARAEKGENVSELAESIRTGDRKVPSHLREIARLLQDEPAYSTDVERMDRQITKLFGNRTKMLDLIHSGKLMEAHRLALGDQKIFYGESSALA